METLLLDRQSLVQQVLNRIQSDMVRVNESDGIITIEPVLDSDRQERLAPDERFFRKGPRAGCMKGTFLWMSDDFNEPLEDFKDYQ
jgi:hypothetical protein